MLAIVRDLSLNDDNGGDAMQLQIMDQFSWLIHTEDLHLAIRFFHERKRVEALLAVVRDLGLNNEDSGGAVQL